METERDALDFSTARIEAPVIEPDPEPETQDDEDLGEDIEDDPNVVDESPTEENA